MPCLLLEENPVMTALIAENNGFYQVTCKGRKTGTCTASSESIGSNPILYFRWFSMHKIRKLKANHLLPVQHQFPFLPITLPPITDPT